MKRRRAKEISQYRSLIAGQDVESHQKQQASELRRIPKKCRLDICARAGVKQKSFLSKRVALAMKTSLNLTWSQHHMQKRLLSQALGVQCESEKSLRDERKFLLSGHLSTVMIKAKEKDDVGCKSSGGFAEVEVPVVYITDLTQFLKELLHNYKKANMLVWKDGMPENEIWVKLSGDHGGKSFKLCLQVCNLERPNAKQNTIVIACMPAKDLHENLAKLTAIYTDQIQELQKEHWKRKRIRLFLFGDYAFLSAIYGLSGARGRYFCLWCLAKTEEMQTSLCQRGHSSVRTLIGTKRDHENFLKKGKAKLQHA